MNRSHLLAGLLIWGQAHAQESLPAFQRVSGLPHAVALRRIPAEGQWDLVVALASGGPNWWSTKDRLGILLLDRNDPDKMQPLAIEPGPNDDCYTRIERFTLEELVLSCAGEKWSTYDNQKFVYDVHARALVSHFSYAPFLAERVLAGPLFVMSDKQRQLLVEIDAATGEPRVANGMAPPAPAETGTRSRVSKEGVTQDGKLHALPQTDIETWKKARPADAKTYGRPEQAQIHEEIGPHQVEDARLWFGKSFYNSEGGTGLGGFGYFDAATASYHLIAPPEMYAWSVSAILVEPDSIWLALYRRGEYGNSAGGLLRWDRKAASTQRWDMPWIAGSIARAGETIFMGTTDGIAALRGDRVVSYFVDRTASGQYRVAAR